MKVVFDPAIVRYFESAKAMQKKYGALTKKLSALINNMVGSNRTDIMSIPGNPHPLKHGAKNVYSVTLKHPFRCVFELNNTQECITILDVIDYHNHQYRVS